MMLMPHPRWARRGSCPLLRPATAVAIGVPYVAPDLSDDPLATSIKALFLTATPCTCIRWWAATLTPNEHVALERVSRGQLDLVVRRRELRVEP